MRTLLRPLLALALAGGLLVVPHARADGLTPAFGPAQSLSVGMGITDPRALTSADLDGDGLLDLIAADRNGDDGTVSVLRNGGGGSFALLASSPFSAGVTGAGLGAAAVGDLTGDGRPDVVTALPTGTVDDGVAVFAAASDGALSPLAGAPFITRAVPSGVALADVDGDTDLDVLTTANPATTADELSILTNDGTGALTLAGSTGAPGTSNAVALASGDLDGDGHPDALVVSRHAGAGAAWVARGTGAAALVAGAGTAVGADPVAVALGDIDGDGDLDGVVADGADDQLRLLRNDGHAALTASSVHVTGMTAATGVALGDLDDDGDADAVVTDGGGDQAAVLVASGGTVGAPTWLATGDGPRSPVIVDLDGDAVADFATADAGDASVRVRFGVGTPVPQISGGGDLGSIAVGAASDPHAVVVTNIGSAPLQITGAQIRGDDADQEILIAQDTCTGVTIAAGGAESCTIRVRFAPLTTGARSATLRIAHADGPTDVSLSGTGVAASQSDADSSDDDSTDTTTVTRPVLATPVKPKKSAKTKLAKVTVALVHRALRAKPGASVAIRLNLNVDASLVVRVKRHGKTVAILRSAAKSGAATVLWKARFGKTAASAGRYTIAVRAIDAAGHVDRTSGTLKLTL